MQNVENKVVAVGKKEQAAKRSLADLTSSTRHQQTL